MTLDMEANGGIQEFQKKLCARTVLPIVGCAYNKLGTILNQISEVPFLSSNEDPGEPFLRQILPSLIDGSCG